MFTVCGNEPTDVMETTVNRTAMTRRGLLTDRERELIQADNLEGDELDRRYQAVSRVRTKIEDRLADDVEILKENHPELYDELQQVVCDD